MKYRKTARVLTALLLTVILLSSLLPATALAADNFEDKEYNYDHIDTNYARIDSNEAPINDNQGTIIDNGSTVTTNNNIIENNWNEVTTNNGDIMLNNGEIATNNNIIEDNCLGGKITDNYGTVGFNQSGNALFPAGEVTTNHAGGVVTKNEGLIVTNEAASGDKAAGKVTTNTGDIMENNGRVDTNNGTIGTTYVDEYGGIGYGPSNTGTVGTNGKDGKIIFNSASGVVEKNEGKIGGEADNSFYAGNEGTVKENTASGWISNNRGEITDNAGKVEFNRKNIKNNTGTVDTNWNGSIENNSGTVNLNNSDTTITNNSGTVEKNYGTVTNNYGGEVTNTGNGKVENQYYGVEIETENAAVSDKTGFTEYEEKDYLKEGASGSVKVTPSEGYTLDKPTLDADSGDMTAEGDETGGWTLTFSNLLKNVKLLLTGKKAEEEPEPKPEPEPEPEPEPQPEPKPEPEPVDPPAPAPAGDGEVDDAWLRFNRKVVDQILNAPANGTVTVDAGGWLSFARMVFEALATRTDVTLTVSWNQGEITIPAGSFALGDNEIMLTDGVLGASVQFSRLAELFGRAGQPHKASNPVAAATGFFTRYSDTCSSPALCVYVSMCLCVCVRGTVLLTHPAPRASRRHDAKGALSQTRQRPLRDDAVRLFHPSPSAREGPGLPLGRRDRVIGTVIEHDTRDGNHDFRAL